MTVRAAAVAGSFYEGDPARLRAHLDALLEPATGTSPPAGPRPAALVVPHAGYIYSGATAAAAYSRLRPWAREITRVVLFGPAHRAPLEGMALPAAEAFETPLGRIPVDGDWLRRVGDRSLIRVSEEAHRLEHSLEVQLPFLQVILGNFSIVPLVVGRCDPRAAGEVIDALWGGPETLVVVSTDLSHFLNYAQARERDVATCERILARDTTLSGNDACGAHALNGLLHSRHGRALALELVGLCNSGDTAGDRRRVVGYGAFVLH